MTLETLIKETAGMDPEKFEAYCETNGIETEWLEVCVTDFNDGLYNVTLPDYGDIGVYGINGTGIKFQ